MFGVGIVQVLGLHVKICPLRGVWGIRSQTFLFFYQSSQLAFGSFVFSCTLRVGQVYR